MLKKLVKNSLLYSIASIISKGISFFLIPIFTLYLSPDEYGIIDFIVVFGNLVNVVVGLEITQALPRFTNDLEKVSEKTLMISTAFWFSLGFYIVFFLIMIFFGDVFNIWMTESEKFKKTYYLAIVSISLNGIYYFLKQQLKWDFRAKAFSLVNILYTVLFLGIAAVSISELSLQLEGYFIGQLIATIFGLVVTFYLSKHYIIFKFSLPLLKRLLRFSTPLVFSSFTMVMATYVDRILIKELLSLNDLGVYGIGYRFASLGGLLMIGIQGAFMPLVYKEYKKTETRKNIKTFFTAFYTVVLISVIFLSLFSYEILVLMTQPIYYEARSIIPILGAAVFFNGMYVFAPGIAIQKKTKVYLFVGIFSLVSNVIFNFLLTPKFGILGASIATLITAIASFIIYIWQSQKYYYINHEVIKLVSASLLCVICSIIFYQIDSDNNVFVLIALKMFLFLLLSILLIFYLVGRTEVNLYLNLIFRYVRNRRNN